MANVDHKVKLLVLYDILYRLTDEEHKLNTDEIINLLSQKGINVSRKILREDIKTLNEYGYEIMEVKNKYFYYYVENRPFDSAEISMLTKVVSASKLSSKHKKNLIEKLADTLGRNKAAVLLNNIVSFDKPKHTNSHIIYSIDAIERAINENKKISFKYFDLDHKGNRVCRKDGKTYIVNPLVMIWSDDNYYLISYDDKHPDTVNYRIDRMENVSVEKADRLERKDLKDFDTEEYRAQVFSMFGGESQKVDLSFDGSMIGLVFDKFGEDISIRKHGDNEYRVTLPIQVSKTFFTWVVGSQGKIKIRSPQNVIDEFNEFIETIKANY